MTMKHDSFYNDNYPVDHSREEVEVGDEIVTLQEWLKRQSELYSAALSAYPYSTEACLGGPSFQRAYSCLTCRKNNDTDDDRSLNDPSSFVMCYACHIECHGSHHEVIEVGPRRDFVCQCGPSCVLCKSSKLSIDAVKKNLPLSNSILNFDGIFCSCRALITDNHKEENEAEQDINIEGVEDDGEEDEQNSIMFQCLGCEDWFHARCLADLPQSLDSFAEFVCKQCVHKHSWFSHLAKKYLKNDNLYLEEGWRAKRCECPECINTEPDWIKEAPVLVEPPPINSHQMAAKLLSSISPGDMATGLEGISQLKAALLSWLKERALAGQQVITKEDVGEFFASLQKHSTRSDGDLNNYFV